MIDLVDGGIRSISDGRHGDPFAVLGEHGKGASRVYRVVSPNTDKVAITTLDGKTRLPLSRIPGTDVFEARLPDGVYPPMRVEATKAGNSWNYLDPYSYGPVLGDMDDYLGAEGSHLKLFDRMGAHPITHGGVDGVHFAVWAPNASRVSLVGDFNIWDPRRHPMRKRLGSGIWEIFVPGMGVGTLYKFDLLGPNGEQIPQKSDPFAFAAELRPKTASVVTRTDGFVWSDADYIERRKSRDQRASPISIYEVHLGSWRKNSDGGPLSYRELAEQLIPYAVAQGFTHLELLPITEHPYDPSWGYQPTGMFAPTARFGTPSDFAFFVDRAHAAGLGVILDWVPAHFPTDAFGLSTFDGTALYEHADPKLGFHPDWNTAIYNFGRKEVANFLINSALYWLERYHIDGLRVDAVASMLYLDYSRKAGEWIPNEHGGRENLGAIAFMRRLNEVCYGQHPGVLMIAEESTAWPGVSQPTSAGGLGFGFKWNMGFMHDTLQYMQKEPVHRKFHQNDLTFGLLYAFSENFVLPLSHDEVVHGKGSLIHKMPGDEWQMFANLRAYYAFMWGYPGKKLLFMGQEFAQRPEWNQEQSLEWHVTATPTHGGVQRLIGDLNRLYTGKPSLYRQDCVPGGFEWMAADDAANSVLAFCRWSDHGEPPVVVICNMTPVPRAGYVVPLPRAGTWKEIANTDATVYGGSGQGNLGQIDANAGPRAGKPASAAILLPPMATLFLEYAGG